MSIFWKGPASLVAARAASVLARTLTAHHITAIVLVVEVVEVAAVLLVIVHAASVTTSAIASMVTSTTAAVSSTTTWIEATATWHRVLARFVAQLRVSVSESAALAFVESTKVATTELVVVLMAATSVEIAFSLIKRVVVTSPLEVTAAAIVVSLLAILASALAIRWNHSWLVHRTSIITPKESINKIRVNHK
jgi:hypothetical protein